MEHSGTRLHPGEDDPISRSLFVRSLTPKEQEQLERAVKRREPMARQRAKYILGSACGLTAAQIAAAFGGSEQAVRDLLCAFNGEGVTCLKPNAPHQDDQVNCNS